MALVVVGSIAFDTIDTPHGHVIETLGGSAVHFAMAASLLTKVAMVGAVGADFPDEHFEPLRRRGVDVSGIVRKEGKTFRWSGRYSSDMNVRETLAVELNVFGEHVPELPEPLRSAEFLFLANGSPVHQLHVMDQMAGPHFAVMDTMDHWIESHQNELKQLFSRVAGVVVNDSEARLLTGLDHLRAARKIMEMGPRCVIVKKGEHGAVMVTEEAVFVIPAYPTTEVRDPTGAGDSFAGGVMGWLAQAGEVTPRVLRQAVAYGTILASFNVEQFGIGRLATLTLEEVEARMREFRGILEF
jgi:sugar/nucleoside kinase (ribokinase family)